MTSYYRAVVEADAPLAYYPLSDAVGSTTAADLSGNGYTGTISGGVTLGQTGLLPAGDPGGTAMLFDGSTGSISLPQTGLPTGAHPWSLECWVSLPTLPGAGTSGRGVAVGFGTTASGEMAELQYYTAQTQWVLSCFADDIGGPANGVAANTLYHLVGTYDGTDTRLYVNAALVATGAFTLNETLSFARIGAGNTSPGDWFRGLIAHVAIYDYTLPAARIAAHYQAGTVGDTALTLTSLYTFKQQIALVYSSTGAFLDVWRDAPLLAGFKEAINSAPQPLRVTLPRPFDMFDTDVTNAGAPVTSITTVAQGNIVKYYLFGPGLPASGLLRYQGTIDKYEPAIGADGSETVVVTLTPPGAVVGDHALVGTLQMGSATATSSSTAVSSTGSQTITVASASGLVVGAYIPIDTGANLEYVTITALSGTSLTATFAKTHTSGSYTVGGLMDPCAMFLYWFSATDPYTSLSYTAPLTLDNSGSTLSSTAQTWYTWQNQTLADIFNTILLMLRNDSPNWYWRINVAGTLTLTKTPTVSPAQNVFYVGQHLSVPQYAQDWMNLRNVIEVVGATNSVSAVAQGTDIGTFGHRSVGVSDTRITTDAQASVLAAGTLADLDRAIYRGTYRVVDYRGDAQVGIGYDIETLAPGQSVQIISPRGVSASNILLWDNAQDWDGGAVWGGTNDTVENQVAQIVGISYGWYHADIEVGALAPSQDVALIGLANQLQDFTLAS